MALVKGTNCGFVTVAPTNDPEGGSPCGIDTFSSAIRDVAPAGAIKVTEIGWYDNTAGTEEANFEVGIYDDTGNDEPENRIGVDATNAKGTSAGWHKVTGLNIDITASSTYWIAIQCDDTNTATRSDFDSVANTGYARLNAQTSLIADWGASDYKNTAQGLAVYAVYEGAEGGGQDGPYVY